MCNSILLRLLPLILFLETKIVYARGGGGHSSGGGGHSSSGGHGGGGYGGSGFSGGGYGGGYVPMGGGLGTLIFIIVVILLIKFFMSGGFGGTEMGEDRASELLHRHDFDHEPPKTNASLSSIFALDPQFSRPAFLDFAYALFAKLHHVRSNPGDLNQQLGAYFSTQALTHYEQLSTHLKEVKGVLVSGSHLSDTFVAGEVIQLTVIFDGNYTEVNQEGRTQSWYTEEKWLFQKKKGILSKPPSQIMLLACPACGAQAARSNEAICSACGNAIIPGNFDWFVLSVEIKRKITPPLLDETVEETGTDLSTVFDEHFDTARQAFQEKHSEFKWSEFKERVRETYFALQTAWTEMKPELVRPFESENIFQTHLYWIEEYKRQHRVNVLQNIELLKIEPVKIEDDHYYESITARIYGRMLDFTVHADTKQVICGDPHFPREFTEYWTFIRTHQSAAQPLKTEGCPACGAP